MTLIVSQPNKSLTLFVKFRSLLFPLKKYWIGFVLDVSGEIRQFSSGAAMNVYQMLYCAWWIVCNCAVFYCWYCGAFMCLFFKCLFLSFFFKTFCVWGKVHKQHLNWKVENLYEKNRKEREINHWSRLQIFK